MIERDIRQLRLMYQALEQFDLNKIPIESVIATLEILLDQLEAIDRSWKSQFRKQWGVLEMEYATVKSEGKTVLPNDSKARVLSAVQAMKSLLQSVLRV